MLRFIKTRSKKACQEKLYLTLTEKLKQNHKVLLIMSGGSNIPILKKVFDKLPEDLSSNLNLILSDERFGPSDFQESNYNKLIKAGFNKKQASFNSILINKNRKDSVHFLEQQFIKMSKESDSIIAQLGIGQDGHIAGLLPNTKALASTSYATGYQGPDFNRISLTFKALKKIDLAIVAAYGPNKKEALEHLNNANLETTILPAMILQEIKSIYIYNDQVGSPIKRGKK